VYFPKEAPCTVESEDSSKKPAVIVDMDGTLALNLSIRSYYDLTRVLEDTPNRPICTLVNVLKNSGYSIIIVSGRASTCQEDTETWLKVHDVPYDAIFMREVGDSRKDAITKKEIYQNKIEPYYNVLYTIDDRNSVVNMWRELGLTCLQVNFGDF
jgi:hypothetical protein